MRAREASTVEGLQAIGGVREVDQLAQLARAGDRRATERLLDLVYPQVRRWAAAQVVNEDDADDVAQAALISAYRALGTFRAESRFETWIYRIVRRVVANWWRQNRRRGRLHERIAMEFVDAASHATIPATDDAQLWRHVRAAFAALPARQREVFDLAELQGMSTAETAQLLGVAEPTVRVHLLRARRAIRSRILDCHPALVEDRYGVQDAS